jgi:hypothetical protein
MICNFVKYIGFRRVPSINKSCTSCWYNTCKAFFSCSNWGYFIFVCPCCCCIHVLCTSDPCAYTCICSFFNSCSNTRICSCTYASTCCPSSSWTSTCKLFLCLPTFDRMFWILIILRELQVFESRIVDACCLLLEDGVSYLHLYMWCVLVNVVEIPMLLVHITFILESTV